MADGGGVRRVAWRQALEKVMGVTVNKLGYKVIKGAGVIQGDGINIEVRVKCV